jgi:hypothetical protein
MNLSAMTPDELVQHAEIFATTDLERCLLAAIAKIREEADREIEEAERRSPSSNLETDLWIAESSLEEAHELLARIADGDEEALAECRKYYGTREAA